MDLDFDIYPPYEAFYIESMLWHTNSALDAVKLVGDWIALVVNDDKKALDLSKEKLFEQLQLIVQHAASLSKYLWPIRGNEESIHQKRGRKIRRSLQTTDKSVLKSRGLRDAMEHFDERLDNYLKESRVGEFIPYYVGADVPRNEVPLHIFKGFYVNPRVFVLLGEEYDLLPIIAEVERIHDLLLQCVNAGYRFKK